MKTSLFEIFKIGIGPSSAHTMGPMLAAGEFVSDLGRKGLDRAVILGLCGDHPEFVELGISMKQCPGK